MSQVCTFTQEQQQSTTPPAAVPQARRPRVREVSSRFMSPSVSCSADLHLSNNTFDTPLGLHNKQQQVLSVHKGRPPPRSGIDQQKHNRFPIGNQASQENILHHSASTIHSLCSSPVPLQNAKIRPLPHFRSSMPDSSGFSSRQRTPVVDSSSPSHRSSFKPSSVFSNPNFSSFRSLPSNTQLRGKKVSSHLEDVHVLRLLHNHHLQWRYANSKADAAMYSHFITAQKSFHALVSKISGLHDSVNRKHAELGQLKKERIMSTILESQMPYLDEWSTLEGEYSSSLSGAIKALQDTSLRLPVIGNVRADITEVGRALNSASNVTELVSSLVESFLPKGEEMNTLITELAGVVSRERALIEECGDLLTKTHILQLEECSLRSQLIQLKLNSSLQAKAN